MSSATGDSLAGWWSTKCRSPAPSKKAMPQPAAWWAVLPPRCAKPLKLNVTSVGVLQFIPRSWHMDLFWPRSRASGADAGKPYRLRRNAREQVGAEVDLRAPAGRLLFAGRALDFHRAPIGLPADGTAGGVDLRCRIHAGSLSGRRSVEARCW